MRNRKHLSPVVAVPLAALCLALALLVSASPPATMDPLHNLPEGALFIVSAGNPSRVMVNALAFARKAGLDELEEPLAKALEALEGKGSLPDDLVGLAARIDWNRRLVIAVYAPTEDSGNRPGLLAYIPASNTRMVQQAIHQASEAAGERASTSLALPAYVLVAMGMDAPADLNFKRGEVPRLAAYPASSLATWVNVEAGKEYINLLSQGLSSIIGSSKSSSNDLPRTDSLDHAWEEDEIWDDEWDGDWDWDSGDWDTADSDSEYLDTDFRGGDNWPGDWPETATLDAANGWNGFAGLNDLGSLMNGAEGPFKNLAALFKDVRSIDFGLTIEADRIWIRSGMNAAPGGMVHRISSDAAAGQLPLPYLPYLEMDALVSMTWSTKADWAIGLLEILYGAILPDEALLGKTLEAMKASMASTGSNGAANFDLRLSDELASAIRAGSPSVEMAIPLLGRGLSFDASGVLQLADRQGFRDALKVSMELVNDPDYRAILKDNKIEMLANRRVGIMDGMPYDTYEYGIQSTDKGSMAEEALDVFRAIASPLMAQVYLYRDDKVYLGFGQPETLRALIGRDQAARPLQTAPRFRALRGGAPADARALIYLSTGTLMRRIMQVMPEGRSVLPFGYGDLYGVLAWFSASPGQLGAGFGLGAEDIKAFRSLPD